MKYLYYDLGKLPTLLSLGNSVLNAHCVQFPLIVFHIDAAVGLCGKSDNESEKSCSDHFRESLWCWVWTFAYVLVAYTLEIGMDKMSVDFVIYIENKHGLYPVVDDVLFFFLLLLTFGIGSHPPSLTYFWKRA